MARRRRQVPLHGRGHRASGSTVELQVRVPIQITGFAREVREHPRSVDRAGGAVDAVRTQLAGGAAWSAAETAGRAARTTTEANVAPINEARIRCIRGFLLRRGVG